MLTILLAAPSFAYLLIYAHNWHHRFGINIKPFNCVTCMSCWIGLALFFLPPIVADAMCCFAVSGVLGNLIAKYT